MNQAGVSVNELPYSLHKAIGKNNAKTLFDVKNGKWADAFGGGVTGSTLTKEQMNVANELYADSIANSDEMRNLENFEKHLNFLDRREKILKKFNSLKFSMTGDKNSLSKKMGAVQFEYRDMYKSGYSDLFDWLGRKSSEQKDDSKRMIYEQLAKMQFAMKNAKLYQEAFTPTGDVISKKYIEYMKRQDMAFKNISDNVKNTESTKFFDDHIAKMSKEIFSTDLAQYDEYGYAHSNIMQYYDNLKGIYENINGLMLNDNVRFEPTEKKPNKAEDYAAALLNIQKELLSKMQTDYDNINAQLLQQKSIQEQIAQIEEEQNNTVEESTRIELEKTQELQRQIKLKKIIQSLENESNKAKIDTILGDMKSSGISTSASSDVINAYKSIFGEANTSKMLNNLDKQAYLQYVQSHGISMAGKTDKEVAAALMGQDLRKLDIENPRNNERHL